MLHALACSGQSDHALVPPRAGGTKRSLFSMTVSYCIPLYNKERYIAAVLDAALAERAATGGEVLVYDDASTDNSLGIAAAFAERHPITVIEGGANRGVYHATATLIGAATQPF